MTNSTYSFSVRGIGAGGEKTLSVQILNDRTGAVLGALVFTGADAVREFLGTMRGLAAVVFPDPQPDVGEPPARDSLRQYGGRQESEE